MVTNLIRAIFLLSLFPFSMSYALDVQVIGTTPQQITLNKKTTNGLTKNSEQVKTVLLNHVQLSKESKNKLIEKSKHLSSKNQLKLSGSLSQKDLGMNGVPVLDQGAHGTCTTFAVTAGLDSVIGKGDYISQVCNLQLGSYLQNFGYVNYSGWDGTFPLIVFQQIAQFGVVNKSNQQTVGCGGLKEYPLTTNPPAGSYMDPEAFSRISEPVQGSLANWVIHSNSDGDINKIKEILNKGDRAIISLLIPRTDLGTVGAVGNYRTRLTEDTWVLTPDVIAGIPNIEAGHTLVVIGYDDNAVAVDNLGKKHKGLIKVRNSWGKWAGYLGDFYLSYDYFELLSYQPIQIIAN